jgi:hypothetical protein
MVAWLMVSKEMGPKMIQKKSKKDPKKDPKSKPNLENETVFSNNV